VVAFIGYTFGFVAPGATVGIFLHGFPRDQFAALDVRAQRSPSRPGAFTPEAIVDISHVVQHVDGTLAHVIRVTNVSTSAGAVPAPIVDVAVSQSPLT
jgi:hypothetical protein